MAGGPANDKNQPSDANIPINATHFMGIPLDVNARQPSNSNLLLSTGFRFLLTRLPHVTYFCQSANLPDVSLGEAEQPTPFIHIKHPGNVFSYGDLEISFVIDEDMENWREIHNWMRSLKNIDEFSEFESNIDAHFSDAKLVILNSAMKANLEVTFKGIFPKSLGGIQFTSDASDSTQVLATASFAYTSYDIVKL